MKKTTNSWTFSAAEREILELALQNPELSNSDIAERTGSRLTLVRDTRREYEDDVELADDVVTETESEESTVDLNEDLSETERAILELVAENPRITNAEIADQTGARIALVRDTRDSYGDQIEKQSVGEDSTETEADADAEPSGPGKPSAAQQEILEVAAADPTLSNADIAEQTGSRITLVRDTLDQYDGPTDATTGTETVGTDDADTGDYSEAQVAILEAAAANPEATTRELADQTDSRVTLVRDTLDAQTADDSDDGGSEPESDDSVELPDDVDAEEFSSIQRSILSAALNNPELTNAEVAAQTDTRLTLVRDTLWQYEHDENPYAGSVDDEPEDESDTADDEEITVDDEIEIPDTTASDVFNDRQRAILETALENPELTNGEIADRTGARVTLVRDTRSTYESGVELADSDESDTATTERSSEPLRLTETQKRIIAAANGDTTISEIAAETDSRIPLVRDTLAVAEDNDVDVGVDEETSAAASETADDTAAPDAATVDDAATTGDAETAEQQADEDDKGISDELLVGIIITIILLFAIIVMIL